MCEMQYNTAALEASSKGVQLGVSVGRLQQGYHQNMISGAQLVQSAEQHREKMDQESEHHEEERKQSSDQHREKLDQESEHHEEERKQSTEHHEAERKQSADQHQESLTQQEEHHDANERVVERQLARAALDLYAKFACGIVTALCVLVMAMAARYHLQSFFGDPCPYLQQLCPADWRISKSDWMAYLISPPDFQCVVSMIAIGVVLVSYVAVALLLPKGVFMVTSAAPLIYAFPKIVLSGPANRVLLGTLAALIVPPGLAFLYAAHHLDKRHDEAETAAESQVATKLFKQWAKRIWCFQIAVAFLSCVVFLGLKKHLY